MHETIAQLPLLETIAQLPLLETIAILAQWFAAAKLDTIVIDHAQ